MPNEIPAKSRRIVLARDVRCVRCASGGVVQWHHRRRRRDGDEHQHCAGNGILLCPACHDYVHHHPLESRERGLIVSAYVDRPEDVPLQTFRGWVLHDHDGGREPFLD